jgi:hypothetical protein
MKPISSSDELQSHESTDNFLLMLFIKILTCLKLYSITIFSMFSWLKQDILNQAARRGLLRSQECEMSNSTLSNPSVSFISELDNLSIKINKMDELEY